MKYSRLVITILLSIIFFVFITSCKKNSTKSNEPEYLDLQWIWVGDSLTWEDTNTNLPGTVHTIKCFYLAEEDTYTAPDSFWEGGVDYLKVSWYKCEWIHYYEDDGYIEIEPSVLYNPDGIVVDQLKIFDVSGYLIEYKIY